MVHYDEVGRHTRAFQKTVSVRTTYTYDGDGRVAHSSLFLA
jgi:hypothetical protein